MRIETAGGTQHRLRVWTLGLVAAASLVAAAAAGAVAATVFSDVPEGHAFEEQIAWMADAGISGGYADGTFRPDAAVTRQAMAAFMQRLAGQDPEVAPTVDAATVGGLTADELRTDPAVLDAIRDELDDLQATVAQLEDENAGLTALLDGVVRTEVEGRDTLRFEAMNVQVVDGSGATGAGGTGLGNLIIGYNEQRTTTPAERTGTHFLVVGNAHEYTSNVGIVAGWNNTVTGAAGSITGGRFNTVTRGGGAISGGINNEVSGLIASVSGGDGNTASGNFSSVLGGRNLTVSADYGTFPN